MKLFNSERKGKHIESKIKTVGMKIRKEIQNKMGTRRGQT